MTYLNHPLDAVSTPPSEWSRVPIANVANKSTDFSGHFDAIKDGDGVSGKLKKLYAIIVTILVGVFGSVQLLESTTTPVLYQNSGIFDVIKMMAKVILDAENASESKSLLKRGAQAVGNFARKLLRSPKLLVGGGKKKKKKKKDDAVGQVAEAVERAAVGSGDGNNE